jgi:hydrogenase maturation protease
MTPPRLLIAGIGNIFLGDDAFGVEVAQRLLRQTMPPEVRIVDFGIRGFDLACALLDPYEAVILIDATPRGGPPGTLYLLDLPTNNPADGPGPGLIDAHSLDPVNVLRLVSTLGGHVSRLLLVGCEPTPLDPDDSEDVPTSLSPPAQAAVQQAIPLIDSLVNRLLRGEPIEPNPLMPLSPSTEPHPC